MDHIVAVCGNWEFAKGRWMFYVDNKRGSKIFPANYDSSFEEFIDMVYEDYNLDRRLVDVELSYLLSRSSVVKVTHDTPPIKVNNLHQLQVFLRQTKSYHMRLCVSITDKMVASSKKQSATIDDDRDNSLVVDSDDEEEGDRFDYCDDSDGASSGDEDFSLYGVLLEEDHDNPTVSAENKGSRVQPKKSVVDNELTRLDLNSLSLSVGQCYQTKDALLDRLKILTVVNHFDYDTDRSTPSLLVVHCWVEGCSWKLRASPVGESPQFIIRIYISEHTCSVTERSARSRHATPEILGRLYVDFIGGVEKSVLPNHLAQSLNKAFGIKIDYWKAHRTLKKARELVRGSAESGYQELPVYLHTIRRANPGTYTRLEVDANNRFKYLFIAFGASIAGFPYMRKVVVVDGTFLQGKYKGTLLLATAQDGNFQIFPIAFAVVDTENDESWRWFFRQLNCIIPDDEGLAIISDRHKSISNAIGEIYPKANRGVCTYHLYKNILVRFRGRDVFRLVKRAANSYRISDFENFFDEIGALNPALHEYLVRSDVSKWARSHFPGDRYNLTTTNIAESTNRALSDARSLPIVRLLEAIRLMMTRWFSTRKHDARQMKTTLTRGVEKLLEGRVPFARTLNVQAIDGHQYQVTGVSSLLIVNLTQRTCSCRRFDLEKLPCVHAIAAAESMKVSRISICHPYYRKTYLYNAYYNIIMPGDYDIVVGDDVASRVCLPPEIRQPPGRPKKSRYKSCLEKGADKKRPRKEHTCSKCNQSGHNMKTCPIA